MYQIVVQYRDVLSIGVRRSPSQARRRCPMPATECKLVSRKHLGRANRLPSQPSQNPHYSCPFFFHFLSFVGKRENSATAATEAGAGDATPYADGTSAPSLKPRESVGAATGATGSGGAVQNRHSFS